MFKKDSFDVPPDKVNTVIGKGSRFQGTLCGNGLIRIDGEAKGDITNKGDVIIGESGVAAIDLKARNVTIAGRFEGTIEAEGRLELKKTSTAVGKFKVNGLLIEEGAVISGGMEMELKDKNKNLPKEVDPVANTAKLL